MTRFPTNTSKKKTRYTVFILMCVGTSKKEQKKEKENGKKKVC
jgi:hypothetical protein